MSVWRKVYAANEKLGYNVVSGLFVITPPKVIAAKAIIPAKMTAVSCLFGSLKSNPQSAAADITVNSEIRSKTAVRKLEKKSESKSASTVITVTAYLAFTLRALSGNFTSI